MGIKVNEDIVTDGLVLMFDPLNNNCFTEGSSELLDLKRNGQTATFIGTETPSVNKEVGYVSLNGQDQRTDIPLTTSISGIYTIDLWFRPHALPKEQYGANTPIYAHQMGTTFSIFMWPEENGESSVAVCYDDSRYFEAGRSKKSAKIGEWMNFTFVRYEGRQLAYYINGELDTPEFTNSDGLRNTATMHFGYDSRFQLYTQMDMGIVKHYTRSLSENEVKKNFEAHRDRYGI